MSTVDPYASTYRPAPHRDTLIKGATVLDGAGGRHDGADVLIVEGKIAGVGRGLSAPAGAAVIDAGGAWVTPGIIDAHSHLGNFPTPYVAQDLANSDVNEDSDPNTAQVRAEDSVTVQDPSFARAMAGGVTTVHVLPGSINLFAGQSVVLKMLPATTVQAMKFPGAPPTLKMSSGENPKSFYAEKGRFPSSRMGALAGQRQAWIRAQEYDAAWRAFERGEADRRPKRDLRRDVLASALRREAAVHIHAYRADDMASLLAMAREFGYRIAAFHHAVEAYKVADLLIEHDVGAVVWSDWWGYKIEAYDAIRENAAFLDAAGVTVSMHSDSWTIGQRLTIEAAKAMASGRRAGLAIAPERAIGWVTLNSAKILGLEAQVGSLEAGKNADVVIWSGDPFSIYSRAEQVFIDGAVVFDRADPARQPIGDFDLGQGSRA